MIQSEQQAQEQNDQAEQQFTQDELQAQQTSSKPTSSRSVQPPRPYTDRSWAFCLASRRGSSIGCLSVTCRSLLRHWSRWLSPLPGWRSGAPPGHPGDARNRRCRNVLGADGGDLAGRASRLLERWALPLSIAGILLVPDRHADRQVFRARVRRSGSTPGVVESDVFGQITTRLTWIWVVVFGGMTVSSSIPPIVRRDASILDAKTPVSFVGYWVIPFSLLGLGALATKILRDRMTAGAGDIVRKTTFVAYGEATIDELYYLAQEHANREVGAGQEAYNVKVGGMGTPLVGDDSRQSWPSTYKVRQSRS